MGSGSFRAWPSQRLMADGYGFGAEGDWKTAALVRAMKVMGDGLPGGTSFMEDYTYHLAPDGQLVLGAHMLEICPSIAIGKPSLEIHPLGIGGKEDPVRLVFDAPTGPALNACLIDLGTRFRLLINEVVAVVHPPAAETPRRARGLGMQARLQDGLRRLDPRRRGAPHRLQLQRDGRNARGFRDDCRRRVRQDR